MVPARRTLPCTVLGASLLLLTSDIAGAQSATDGWAPGANSTVYAMATQTDGKVVVGGAFSTMGGGLFGNTERQSIGRVNVDGTLDTGFNPGTNSYVDQIIVQADGKILVAGAFSTIGGGHFGSTPRSGIARLNADGSVDAGFVPGCDGNVYAMALQPDGKILIGGSFAHTGGLARADLSRLYPDGTTDPTFNPGANGAVYALAVQPDGMILVGGIFSGLGGGTGATARLRVGRLTQDGMVDPSFNPGATDYVNWFDVQADGKIVAVGNFTGLGGGTGATTRNYIGRLNPDGSLDASFNPGANNRAYVVAQQANGQIIVGGDFTALGGGTGTTARSKIGRLNSDGSVDGTFDPGASNTVTEIVPQADGRILLGGSWINIGGGGSGTIGQPYLARLTSDGLVETGFDPGSNNFILSMAVQPDGKVLLGGQFTTLGGSGTGTTTRNHIGRLNADGSLDTTFNPGANGEVDAIAVQPDGKILVGGGFTALGGGTGTTARNFIGRLNADGSVDGSFDPGANGAVSALALEFGTGFNAGVWEVVVGGTFTTLGGGGAGTGVRNNVGRLFSDGSLDTGFTPGANGPVQALVVQGDGKILVAGNFTGLGGGTGTTVRNNIGRLNTDGSVDAGFNPGANAVVDGLALQADGSIIAYGGFTALGGGTGTTTRNFVGRISSSGTVDSAFNPGATAAVLAAAVQADGEILVGGLFTGLGGGTGTTTRNHIGRLNADGSVDAFDPGANQPVTVLGLQADGKVLVAGGFTTLGGGGTGITARHGIGRLTNTGPAPETLTVAQNQTLTWLRSGTGPEITRATFEFSLDGASYTLIGAGTRVTGGWKLTGANLPTNQIVFVRARGYDAYDGGYDGSSGIVEEITTVAPEPTTLTDAPAFLNFGANKNGAGGALVSITPSQNVIIGYVGVPQTWTATSDQPWLQITNGTQTGLQAFTATLVNPGNVIGASTSLGATITVTASGAPPLAIPVSLAVQQSTDTWTPPFGQIDTPVQNATGVQSAIALTGWALDDIGVTEIDVFRDCKAFDNPASCQIVQGNNVVFVGTGNFIAGARPDVEAAYPTYPEADRAGWGLLVLTNFLPHVPNQQVYGGQGAVQIYAFAKDVEGGMTLLGRTTTDHTATSMTLDNDDLAAPFGNIDTPTQSGTASGAFPVFGWVLTPDTDTVAGNGDILMPLSGPNILVLVDGVSVGAMTYNNCRGDVGNPPPAGVYCDDDVSDAFGNPAPVIVPLTPRSSNPTKFRNLDAGRGAIGVFVLGTCAIPNGQHTIVLQATDSASRVGGIGSRFFTTVNHCISTDPPDMTELLAAPARNRGPSRALDAWRLSGRPVSVRTGFDSRTPMTEIARTSAGVRAVTLGATGRLEIGLGAPAAGGYLVANGQLRDLPVGSHLDLSTGVFTWTPPPGYFGTYRLALLVGGERVVVDVTVVDDSQAASRLPGRQR